MKRLTWPWRSRVIPEFPEILRAQATGTRREYVSGVDRTFETAGRMMILRGVCIFGKVMAGVSGDGMTKKTPDGLPRGRVLLLRLASERPPVFPIFFPNGGKVSSLTEARLRKQGVATMKRAGNPPLRGGSAHSTGLGVPMKRSTQRKGNTLPRYPHPARGACPRACQRQDPGARRPPLKGEVKASHHDDRRLAVARGCRGR